MGYVVIKHFTDLQDDGHSYHAGDIFPREGLTVSQKRLKELSSSNNRQNIPLIKKTPETKSNASKDNGPRNTQANSENAKENVSETSEDVSKVPTKVKRKRKSDAE